MKYFIAWLCLLCLASHLHAEIITLTASTTATTTATQTGSESSTNSTQFLVPTNVTAQILHFYNYPSGYTVNGGGVGYLMVRVNGLDFKYSSGSAYIIGPATITLVATVTVINQNVVATEQDNAICTILTTPANQDTTNLFIPNTSVVIPADSGGPVNIILESSVDLINWIPSDPGTYGTTTTNRFFRVRATR